MTGRRLACSPWRFLNRTSAVVKGASCTLMYSVPRSAGAVVVDDGVCVENLEPVAVRAGVVVPVVSGEDKLGRVA